MHMTIEIAYGVPCLFHQKEGQEPLFSPGLPKAQCDECEEHLPLPLIPDILNKVSEAKAQYFTKLDIRWGYNNIRNKREMSGKPPSRQIEVCLSP